MSASRVGKGKVVSLVVEQWRNQSPPGRFLALTDPKMGEGSPWHDIGDKLALKKTAKRLREGNHHIINVPKKPSSNSLENVAGEPRKEKRVHRRVVSNESFFVNEQPPNKRPRYETNNDISSVEKVPSLGVPRELLLDFEMKNFFEEAEFGMEKLLMEDQKQQWEEQQQQQIEKDQFQESWMYMYMNDCAGGKFVDEIAFNLPSAACLIEAICFD
jgi:hypothetical protein